MAADIKTAVEGLSHLEKQKLAGYMQEMFKFESTSRIPGLFDSVANVLKVDNFAKRKARMVGSIGEDHEQLLASFNNVVKSVGQFTQLTRLAGDLSPESRRT